MELNPFTPRYVITVTKPPGGFAAELTDAGPLDEDGNRTAEGYPKTLTESFADVVELSKWLDQHAQLGATRRYPDGPLTPPVDGEA